MEEKTDNKATAEAVAQPLKPAGEPEVLEATETSESPEAAAGPLAEQSAVVAEIPEETGDSADTAGPVEPEPPRSAPASGGASPRGSRLFGSLLTFIALVVALAALGLAAWMYLQQSQQAADQQALETRVDAELSRISATAEGARAAIDDALQASRRAGEDIREQLAEERRVRAEAELEQREALALAIAAQQSQRRQLNELSATDRTDWLLAEAEYLLRLAYQRVLMGGDVSSAEALLRSADGILRDLDDIQLLPTREAIARDLAALRAVPRLDLEGTWLRLEALAERVDGLLLFDLQYDIEPTPDPDPEAGIGERIAHGFAAALDRLRGYINIRRREQPFEVLIDPQWEQLVRQNLRMQIAQAQAALLAGNPTLYEASLGSTRRWLGEFFDFNETDVAALDAELDALLTVEISRDHPDISASLLALKAAIDARHAAGG